MESGDAIVLASIIIALGAVTITAALIIKKKTAAITLFTLFTIIIAVLIVFKNDLLDFSRNLFPKDYQKVIKSYKPYYKDLSYKKLDLQNTTIDDILFLFGSPHIVLPDSSMFIYGKSEYLEYSFYSTEIKEYLNFFIDSTRILKDVSLIDTIFDYPYNRILEPNYYIIQSKNSMVDFIGEYGYICNDLGKKFYWSYNSIVDNFGKPDLSWISEEDIIRIYKIRRNFFYFRSGKCFAWGASASDGFDPTKVTPLTKNLRFKVWKKY